MLGRESFEMLLELTCEHLRRPTVDLFSSDNGDNKLCEEWLCPARSALLPCNFDSSKSFWANPPFEWKVVGPWFKLLQDHIGSYHGLLLLPLYMYATCSTELRELGFKELFTWPAGSQLFSRPNFENPEEGR